MKSVISEEILFEKINSYPQSEWIYETTDAFEAKCVDIINAIVLRDINQNRSGAIAVAQMWVQRASSPDRKKVYDRVLHEFIIATDNEYELLKNQLFS